MIIILRCTLVNLLFYGNKKTFQENKQNKNIKKKILFVEDSCKPRIQSKEKKNKFFGIQHYFLLADKNNVLFVLKLFSLLKRHSSLPMMFKWKEEKRTYFIWHLKTFDTLSSSRELFTYFQNSPLQRTVYLSSKLSPFLSPGNCLLTSKILPFLSKELLHIFKILFFRELFAYFQNSLWQNYLCISQILWLLLIRKNTD